MQSLHQTLEKDRDCSSQKAASFEQPMPDPSSAMRPRPLLHFLALQQVRERPMSRYRSRLSHRRPFPMAQGVSIQTFPECTHWSRSADRRVPSARPLYQSSQAATAMEILLVWHSRNFQFRRRGNAWVRAKACRRIQGLWTPPNRSPAAGQPRLATASTLSILPPVQSSSPPKGTAILGRFLLPRRSSAPSVLRNDTHWIPRREQGLPQKQERVRD